MSDVKSCERFGKSLLLSYSGQDGYVHIFHVQITPHYVHSLYTFGTHCSTAVTSGANRMGNPVL